MRLVTAELLDSNKTYKPVLLEIMSINQEEGNGTCVKVYAGFMSKKHIYAELASDMLPNGAYPKYIRVKRGKTTGSEENYRCIPEYDCSALVKILECPRVANLSTDKRVQELSEDEPAVSIIKQVWPPLIRYQALSAVSWQFQPSPKTQARVLGELFFAKIIQNHRQMPKFVI